MIHSIHLRNFRRFADETVTFLPGVNLLEGPNNAGKSTIFLAIEYALFGGITGLRTPAALVRPGQRGMNVVMVFRGRDGAWYRLQRSHMWSGRSRSNATRQAILERFSRRPTTSEETPKANDACEIVIGPERSDLELARTVLDLTGASRRFFDVAVHMRQGQMSNILDGAKELDTVLGVTAANFAGEELRAAANEAEKELGALPVLEANLQRATKEFTDLNNWLKDQYNQQKNVRAQRATLEADSTTRKRALNLGELARLALARLEAEARTWRGLYQEKERLRTVGNETVMKTGSIDALRQREKTLDERGQQVENARQQLQRDEEQLRVSRRELDTRHGDLAGRYARRQVLLAQGGPACETCGQPIDRDLASKELAAWLAELAILERRSVELDEQQARLANQATALVTNSIELARQSSDLKSSLELLANLDRQAAVLAPNLRDAEREFVQAAEAARSALLDWTKVLAIAANQLPRSDNSQEHITPPKMPTDEVTEAGAALDTMARGLTSQPPRLLDELPPLRASFEQCARLLQQWDDRAEARASVLAENEQKLHAEVARGEQRLAMLTKEITDTSQQIDPLRGGQARVEIFTRLFQAFKELQVQLRQRAVEALARDTLAIHRELANQADAEYSALNVEATSYEVHVTPHDVGEVVPAALCQGGGHRLLLGLAYRLAVARRAGRPLFLLLDEPTDGLDQQHRQNLLTTLQRLQLADQILVITHQDLGPAPVRRLRVQPKGRVSTVEIASP